MKKLYIVIAIALSLLLLGAFAIIAVHKLRSPGATPTPPNPFNFGAGTTTQPSQADTISLRLANGTIVTAPNFVPANQPEGADAVNGYQVTQGNTEGYTILFYPNSSSFLLSLSQEPLGETRRQAEQFLQSKLQLTKDQLCQLNAQVFTSIDVNEAYAGMNLGLSFCPGAVKLPQ